MSNFQYQTTSMIPSRFDPGSQIKIHIETGNHQDLLICNEIIKKIFVADSNAYQKHQELQLQNVNSDDTLVLPLFLLLCVPGAACRHPTGNREFVRDFRTPEGEESRLVLSGYDPLGVSLLERKLIFGTLSRCLINKQREVKYKTFTSLLRDLGYFNKCSRRRKLVKMHFIPDLQKLKIKFTKNRRLIYEGPIFENTKSLLHMKLVEEVYQKLISKDLPIILLSKEQVDQPKGRFSHMIIITCLYQSLLLGASQRKEFSISQLTSFLRGHDRNAACDVDTRLENYEVYRTLKRVVDNLQIPFIELGKGSQTYFVSKVDSSIADNLQFAAPSYFQSFFPSNEKETWLGSEDTMRRILEEHTQVPWAKIRPEWLINPNTGCKLELDCYSEKYKTAFEYQGHQHYESVPFYGGETALELQKERDQAKRVICSKHGVRLIEIDGRDFSMQNQKQFKEKIINSLNSVLTEQ